MKTVRESWKPLQIPAVPGRKSVMTSYCALDYFNCQIGITIEKSKYYFHLFSYITPFSENTLSSPQIKESFWITELIFIKESTWWKEYLLLAKAAECPPQGKSMLRLGPPQTSAWGKEWECPLSQWRIHIVLLLPLPLRSAAAVPIICYIVLYFAIT